MYKEFADLCEKRNVTPYRVAKGCGFSNVTLSDWKNKGSTPRADKLIAIARYLGTSVEYLVTGEDPAQLPQIVLSSDEEDLLASYRKLNRTGKEKAADYINDLTDNDKYIQVENVKKGEIA